MVTVVDGIISRGGDAQSCGTPGRTDGRDCQAGDEGRGNKRADKENRERRHIPGHISKVKVVAVPVKSASASAKIDIQMIFIRNLIRELDVHVHVVREGQGHVSKQQSTFIGQIDQDDRAQCGRICPRHG